MIEFSRVFLDTAPIIYYLQESEIYFDRMAKILLAMNNANVQFVSSDITIAEYCVYPYRIENLRLIREFEHFLQALEVEIISTSEWIAKKSAWIRSKYPAFKTMDSLQLATAVIGNCDLFLTNDKQLRQFDELKCMTIDDFNNICGGDNDGNNQENFGSC